MENFFSKYIHIRSLHFQLPEAGPNGPLGPNAQPTDKDAGRAFKKGNDFAIDRVLNGVEIIVMVNRFRRTNALCIAKVRVIYMHVIIAIYMTHSFQLQMEFMVRQLL